MKARLILLLWVLIPLMAHAQIGKYRNDWAVGVSGGYTLNKISFNPTIKQKYHEGLTFGLSARYTCEKYFAMLCAIQVELNYTQLGWTENIELCTDTYKRNINYMQVPILAHLGFGKERGGAKGFLVLGPQIGYVVSENEERGGNWTLPLQRPNNITEQYDTKVQKKFEYGLTGGLGVDISTKSGHHFILEGRYYYALSDIFNNSKKDTFGRSANGAILAKLSYLFDVIKNR